MKMTELLPFERGDYIGTILFLDPFVARFIHEMSSQQTHDIKMTSSRRIDASKTSFRVMYLLGYHDYHLQYSSD